MAGRTWPVVDPAGPPPALEPILPRLKISHKESCRVAHIVHGVSLAESEHVIRDFNVTRMERPKADGHLLITNRRIIFASEASGPLGGRSALLREVHLQDVAGITGYLGKGWPIGRVIFIR